MCDYNHLTSLSCLSFAGPSNTPLSWGRLEPFPNHSSLSLVGVICLNMNFPKHEISLCPLSHPLCVPLFSVVFHGSLLILYHSACGLHFHYGPKHPLLRGLEGSLWFLLLIPLWDRDHKDFIPLFSVDICSILCIGKYILILTTWSWQV